MIATIINKAIIQGIPLLFGSSRFLFEFLRDNSKMFWGISNLAIHALFMFFVGVVWLIILAIKKKKTKVSV